MKQLDVNNTNTLFSSVVETGNFYNFKFICTNNVNKKGFVKDHIFTFTNAKKERFQANLHEYDIGLFAVKFYAKKHRYSRDRFSLKTNNGDAITVLKTMVAIILYALKQYPNHSFCFIGNASDGESVNQTKRFKVYKKLMQRYFSPNNFSHNNNPEISFYSMINRKANVTEMNRKIIELGQTELVNSNETNTNNLSRNTK